MSSRNQKCTQAKTFHRAEESSGAYSQKMQQKTSVR